MENLGKRCNVKLVTDGDKFLKLVAKPTYKSCKIFSENLVAVNMKLERLKLDKPSYVGMCILDLSKVHMYDFFYNYLKPKYRDRVQLLLTDTDSFILHIETDDVYKDLYQHRDLFDNSNYKKDSPFYFGEKKKVIGKFKDETAGEPITEFVGLKSKMYTFITEKETHKAAKGVKKNIIKRDLQHSDYLDTLQNSSMMRHKMKGFRSDCHQVSSYEFNEISLSCYDDKRNIHNDGITSYAYGHYKRNK